MTTTTTTTAICVFAKAPRAGLVKTRLAATIGADDAAALARAFLLDTLSAATAIADAAVILALDGDPDDLPALADDVVIWSQGGGDLGARQERVLRAALQMHARAIAIGTDAPSFPAPLLRAAIAGLNDHDAVVTPATDGGYCLLGLRTCLQGLLADLPWSSADTAVQTVARLRDKGLTVLLTAPWFDVDTIEDLARLQHTLDTDDAIAAKQTRAALQRLSSSSWFSRSR